jgi:hypothetical protein
MWKEIKITGDWIYDIRQQSVYTNIKGTTGNSDSILYAAFNKYDMSLQGCIIFMHRTRGNARAFVLVVLKYSSRWTQG